MFCYYYCHYKILHALISPTHPGTKRCTDTHTCTCSWEHTTHIQSYTYPFRVIFTHTWMDAAKPSHTLILCFVIALLSSIIYSREKAIRVEDSQNERKLNTKERNANLLSKTDGWREIGEKQNPKRIYFNQIKKIFFSCTEGAFAILNVI